jgi:(1->4)-alpha-D-glucan 1-alpha-D-glucosylmutase
VGAWPIDEGRLTAYLEKAVREAKRHTSWTRRTRLRTAIADFARALMGDAAFRTDLEAFVAGLDARAHQRVGADA